MINDAPEPIEADLRVALYRDGCKYGAAVCTPVAVRGRSHRSIHADALLGGFRDLTCAYRFGPGGHDVVAATLRDAGSTTIRAAACYILARCPSERVSNLGLPPVRNRRAMAICWSWTRRNSRTPWPSTSTSWIPDDNYFHVEPGEPRRVLLRPRQKGAALHGRVSALNGRSPSPLAVTEPVDARG